MKIVFMFILRTIEDHMKKSNFKKRKDYSHGFNAEFTGWL